uniref:Retrovirus-related Pol polyprotein from transposon TNT 1-94 n=1 Tax=Tanacetum cinerariifolium TaxID=118510 RepID=A0A6L2L078_TANCI|nr:hypothetical protein [Tanacetum cinerariifolium]
MINSIQNVRQPFPIIAQVSLAGNAHNAPPNLKDLNNKTAKDLWDALERQMRGSEYGEQDRKAIILYEYETFKAIEGEQLLDTYRCYLQVINDLKKCGYKKDNCDVNDALGYKKKAIVVTSDPLALVDDKMKVSKRKEKVVVSSDSEGSGADDFSELKKITALLAKAFNRRKFYSKLTNNNLRTSSTSQSANKKQEFVKLDDKKKDKKAEEKKRHMSKVKCYNCKKEGHFAKDCKKAKVKDYKYYKTKMLLDKKDKSDESSSSAEETIAEVSYYTSESKSEYEFETLEYYDNSTNYGLFVNDNDDQEIFHDAIGSASENFTENHIDSQKDYDKSEVNYNDSEEKEHLVDKLIRMFNHKIAKCQKRFESIENANSELENQSENDCYVVEKECDKVENSKVIAPGLFKLSVSQSVSPISMSKKSCDSKNVENKLKRKRYLDTFSSVRRPKHSGVIWKKKESSNTFNVDLSFVSHSKLNKDKMCDLFDENNLFIFDDESVRISPVSKMPFRKKSCDSINVRSKSNSNKSLLRTVHRWLPKMQPLAEPVAKWIPRIVQIYLWINDSGCLNHMTGNRSMLTNFVEKFLGTVRFGNNDFVVIAGYGDVVIGSMTLKKVYYVEGLGHNLFSVGQFCSKGLQVAFQKSTCFVRNEDGVDLLTGDRSSNFYTIALNEIALNSSTCLLAKASSSQSWLWNQRKIHRKHHKSKTAFASNKLLYLLHMDLCGPMCIESINGKRYVLVVVDDYSRYTWVFFLHSKDEAYEVIISFIKKTQVNLQLQVQRIQTDNSKEFKNKTLAKFFDEVGITQQFFAARTPQQNGVVERRNRTLVEAARTRLTFANLQSFLWAEAIATACFTQNHSIIHKRFDKTPYELMNKRKPNIKFLRVFGCRCYLLNDYEDVGKLKAKGDIGVFVGYSKESAAFRIYNKQTCKIHESIMKTSTTDVETSKVEIPLNEEEVFHEVSKSFQGESSSSSLNDDVQQSLEEVILPQTNTQSISNNMIPNVDEASTSRNVFNECLEDAYFCWIPL